MDRKQETPFCVQVEMAEGCNFRCKFCGINAIRGKELKYEFLTLDNAEKLARKINYSRISENWNPRIEFAMHGEPTANPHWLEILEIFRAYNYNSPIMLTTNGLGFAKDTYLTVISALKFADTVAIDMYEAYNLKNVILANLANKADPLDNLGIDIYGYPFNDLGNPHKRPKKGEKRLIFVQDISIAQTGTHSKLNNHAGSAGPLDFTFNRPCAKPFREMSIRWNGDVSICCNDWPGKMIIGNAIEKELEEIWQDPKFVSARKFLIKGERVFSPCKGCNAVSYRTGCLPDKLGKERHGYPEPTQEDYLLLGVENEPR